PNFGHAIATIEPPATACHEGLWRFALVLPHAPALPDHAAWERASTRQAQRPRAIPGVLLGRPESLSYPSSHAAIRAVTSSELCAFHVIGHCASSTRGLPLSTIQLE